MFGKRKSPGSDPAAQLSSMINEEQAAANKETERLINWERHKRNHLEEMAPKILLTLLRNSELTCHNLTQETMEKLSETACNLAEAQYDEIKDRSWYSKVTAEDIKNK